ncbi:MAG TPA: M12 family metallo-peptidase [Dokdonella sp.]|uniref:M12 family metallo-peptidase n=1 Tax=Dokdonella sp. TaxID=2291710 RepID=UPI002D80D130|nr:M12 family metallo-peptidase [Dokdonella sp.]HET9034334.1 M12 family metallo-peptidase [Dokdonella sp.]
MAMRVLLVLMLCILASGGVYAASGSVLMDSSSLARLADAEPGAAIEVDAFPAGPGITTAITFKRFEIYAPGARIFVVDAQGKHEIPRSSRIHLSGYSKDGSTRLGLSFDADSSAPPYGAGSGPNGAFELHSERIGNGWRLRAISAEESLPAGVKAKFEANEDSLPNPYADSGMLDHLLVEQAPLGTLRNAVVAVDTDTSFMTKRFAGNTTSATAWIADLIAQMNVMYQRDLDVNLLQGTTFLRTASDPYANTDSPASSAMLNEFGNYWSANYSSGGNAVDRAFAMLLSGNSSSGNSASGIAWVNYYCRTSGNGGSYSTNQIFTNSQIPVSLSASLVGHELGHNFGAAHTHCTNTTTGLFPTGSNTIDQCSTAGSGCYSGTTSCPSSGPGAPRGTVMSYCNTFNSGACGQNVQIFHPTHITALRVRIAANTPSCLSLGNDTIFANGFD